MSDDNSTPTANPAGASAPGQGAYEPLTKHYVFNETGNILLCTTGDGNEDLGQSFKEICGEVSVFFAAMTKAISSVTNPLTGKPYSIYNYKALKKVINNSGLFVGVNRTTSTVASAQAGDTFAQELLKSLLGRDFGQTPLHFARGLFESIGKETRNLTSAVEHLFGAKSAKPAAQPPPKNSATSGNIFFICESLLGMPLISAVLVYIEPENVGKPFDEITNLSQARPIGQRISRSYTFTKDTYLFVAPSIFKSHAQDLNTSNMPQYQDFIDKLAEALKSDDDGKDIVAPPQS